MNDGYQNRPPTKLLWQIYCGRLGRIFSNLAILFVILGFAGVIGAVSIGLFVALGFLLLICSFGAILVAVPDYIDILTSGSETLSGIVEGMSVAAPYLAIFGAICAALSVVLLQFDKRKKHWARIVFSVLIVAVNLALFITSLTGGAV